MSKSRILSKTIFLFRLWLLPLVLIAVFTHCSPQPSVSEDGLNVGGASAPKMKAPLFEVTDLQGKKLSLENLQGKIVFLDFWATWCGPCVISAPQVEKLNQDYKGRGLEVVSISLDDYEDLVHEFARKMGMTNRVAMVGGSDVNVKYRVSGIPAFYLIDKEGYLVAGWTGYSRQTVDEWRKEIDSLLKA